jgi:hypothetical protein
MKEIVFTDYLELGEQHLAVHLASDRQVYIRLSDLCDFIGMDPARKKGQILHDPSLADLLSVMSLPGENAKSSRAKQAAFLNLAGLSYWLGMVHDEPMERPEYHDCLVRYSFDFLDTTWIMYRAACAEFPLRK